MYTSLIKQIHHNIVHYF